MLRAIRRMEGEVDSAVGGVRPDLAAGRPAGLPRRAVRCEGCEEVQRCMLTLRQGEPAAGGV